VDYTHNAQVAASSDQTLWLDPDDSKTRRRQTAVSFSRASKSDVEEPDEQVRKEKAGKKKRARKEGL
jgi:hypothetical protein